MKRSCTCWPSRHIHLVLSVPTSRSHFLIQLALCCPTVKVKVCELLRGGPLRERVCVRVCTSQLRTRALTKKWPFQADDKWLAGFIDAFTLRCGFSDKIIDSGQVTSRGISWASVTNYNVFTKKTVASLSRARRTLNKQRVKRRQREGVWVGANAERGLTDLTKKLLYHKPSIKTQHYFDHIKELWHLVLLMVYKRLHYSVRIKPSNVQIEMNLERLLSCVITFSSQIS